MLLFFNSNDSVPNTEWNWGLGREKYLVIRIKVIIFQKPVLFWQTEVCSFDAIDSTSPRSF